MLLNNVRLLRVQLFRLTGLSGNIFITLLLKRKFGHHVLAQDLLPVFLSVFMKKLYSVLFSK